MSTSSISHHPQSAFINTLSWGLIVFTSIGFVCSFSQSIALFAMSHSKPLVPPNWVDMPVFTYIMDHFGFIVTSICILFFLGVCASIGLLQRKEWARQGAMILLAISILVLQAMLVSQWVGVEQLPASVIPDTRWLFFLKVSSAAWVVSLSFLAGWLIKRLDEKRTKVIFRAEILKPVEVSLSHY